MATQSCRNALACHRCSPAKGIYRVSSAFNSIASQVVRRHRRGGSWGKHWRQAASGKRATGNGQTLFTGRPALHGLVAAAAFTGLLLLLLVPLKVPQPQFLVAATAATVAVAMGAAVPFLAKYKSQIDFFPFAFPFCHSLVDWRQLQRIGNQGAGGVKFMCGVGGTLCCFVLRFNEVEMAQK